MLLSEAFKSTFHEKFEFEDFLSTSAIAECKSIPITKENREKGFVFNPSEKLRRFHRFLNSFIFDFADVNDSVVHGYRNNKSTVSSISLHAESKYFFKSDIETFFSSLTDEDVKKVLLTQVANSPVSDIDTHIENIISMTTVNGVLPVGFATSPNLSNSCLFGFDNALQDFCKGNSLTYSRYADDIILSSISKDRLINIELEVQGLLNHFFNGRLRLNKSKTKRIGFGGKVKMLGVVVLPNGKLTVDIKIKRQMEVLMHFFSTDKKKYSDYMVRSYEGRMSLATGQLRYLSLVDSDFIEKLRKRYGNLTVDYFLNGTEK